MGTELPGVSSSEARLAFQERKASDTTADGGGVGGDFPLRLARVQLVDYKKMEVGLIVLGPGNKDQYKRVPLTFPGAGRRNFMGVIPEVNDVCIIGYASKESGFSRQPYIVGWMVPGTTFGYNWSTTQTHGEDEYAWTPKNQVKTEGILGRARQKLRQVAGGNALISSSQGSDLLLSESAALVNRRGNELTLRDQDQALVVRSLQQFHVGAGFRVYGGIAQRDARLLPTQIFSDGVYWDSSRQRNGDENTLPAAALGPSPIKKGALSPNPVFNLDGSSRASDIQFGQNSDPYALLQRGLFIDQNGNPVGPTPTSDGVYGGKPIRRVAVTGENGLLHPEVNSYTEYRLEVAHDSDGRLPVSEQTDGFDSDRLPLSPPVGNGGAIAGKGSPFVEFVLGTVIGNDAFGSEINLYGLPLRAQIFDGATPSPVLLSSLGTPEKEQLAQLLRVKDPQTLTTVSFTGMTKSGGGVASYTSYQERVSGEFRGSYGSLTTEIESSYTISTSKGRAQDNVGLELSSAMGAVLIRAGGASSEGPGLLLDSVKGVRVTSQGTVQISGSTVSVKNASKMAVDVSTGVEIKSGGAFNSTAKTISVTSLGRADYTYGGPTDGNPTNAPLREVQIVGTPATGFLGGAADKYTLLYGSRDELFVTASLNTTLVVGDRTISALAGTIRHIASVSSESSLSPALSNTIAPAVSITASAGSLQMSSTAVAQLSAPQISLAAPAGIDLAVGAGLQAGLILTDGCIDGLTGKQFRMQGTLGVPNLRVY
jgi:hypothetical protein